MSASGGSISERSNAGFVWHREARLLDGTGRAYFPAERAEGLIAERPAGSALAAAIVAGAFRVGGEGPVPVAGFETLTSGSTGAPRRIRRSFESWVQSFAVNSRLFGIGPGLRVAVLGRLTQSLALYAAMEGMHLGAEVHLLEDLRPDRQALALVGMDLIYASPAQMRQVVEAGVAWPGLRHLVIGGSKLDAGLRAAVMRLAPGGRISEFYGAAETSFITLAGPDCPDASVGRAYPGVEIQVVAGEIWVKSPYLFAGYAGESGPAHWRDGYLSVGEMGEMRGGFLFLKGRAGRMVTVADQNVFPEEIEGFLLGLMGVRQAAVVPLADRKRGVHLVAAVQGDAGLEGAILRALRVRLGVLCAPKRLIWLRDWPVLPSGKTDLQAIAEQVAQ